ncbi:tRNA (adenosine(37)-N6)-dimethylallyltransferase MiaA [Candidatus Margulisiibacteriota bacterium]
MEFKTYLIIGPTAIGKTEYAVNLALELGNAEIVSVDSMQVYRYMDIGTGKPTKEEQKGITHHLIDCLDPDDEYNLTIFLQKSKEIVEKLYSENKIPIFVGGTGLYIKALLEGFVTPGGRGDKELRKHYEGLAKEKGREHVWEILKKKDPRRAEQLKPNDLFRVVRALEYFDTYGVSILDEREKGETFLKEPISIIGLTADRKIIYERINKRVDDMFERGLVDEVRGLLERGYDPSLTSLQALGYKETISYLNGEMDLDECKELIKKRTRAFAKRQYTWYRKLNSVEWISV